ncbi:MAG: sigma 54-interacting transcriptional regulator [Phycisphaerales bacterium]|nr:sigma 54-interacting transcriptional regulator [Phycisphaerales bacterium]
MSNRVVIGLLGPALDRGAGPDRWSQWRPTVSLCQHEELLISRIELIHDPRYSALVDVVAEDIRSVSPETQVRLNRMTFRDPWDFEEVYGKLHDFARKYEFDTEHEDYLIHVTTGTHVAQICLFLLTESRHLPGRLIQSSPPKRRSSGSPGNYAIIDLDLSRYDRIASRFDTEQREGTTFLKAGIETRNPAFNRMIDEIEHVAIHSSAPMLLTGPTGAGKSSLARRVFDLKKLRHGITGRFVEVNCATIRGDGAMSALFGHKRGAFTGAARDRAGLLREADAGLLFLDEVGELGIDEQAMLLRAVEEKRFFPVGGDREVESDFQLICGTNRDLGESVRSGAFRDDLLARINMWSFEMPGLAARREDIEPNIRYELLRLTDATGRRYQFNKEAFAKFLSFSMAADSRWCGNFRDLNAAIARMATMSPTGRFTTEVVDREIDRLRMSWRMLTTPTDGPDASAIEALIGERLDDIDEFDRVQLVHVVAVCRDSRSLSDAGRRLFGATRKRRKIANDADRLRKYLARFGLDWASVVRDVNS